MILNFLLILYDTLFQPVQNFPTEGTESGKTTENTENFKTL